MTDKYLGYQCYLDEFLARFNTRSMDEHERNNASLSGVSGVQQTYGELTQ